MVLVATAPAAARLRFARFAALVMVGSLVSHDLVALVRDAVDGGASMQATEHHGYWTVLTLVAMVVAGFGAAFGITGILRLGRAARRLPAPAVEDGAAGVRGYISELDHLWPRLFVAITVVFTVQENLAFAATGHGMHGAAILFCPEHPLSVPVLGWISLVLAAVGGWFRWRTAALQRWLRAARAAPTHERVAIARAPGRRWGLVAAAIAHDWLVLRRQAGRAPPAPAGA